MTVVWIIDLQERVVLAAVPCLLFTRVHKKGECTNVQRVTDLEAAVKARRRTTTTTDNDDNGGLGHLQINWASSAQKTTKPRCYLRFHLLSGTTTMELWKNLCHIVYQPNNETE